MEMNCKDLKRHYQLYIALPHMKVGAFPRGTWTFPASFGARRMVRSSRRLYCTS